jgi:hypothetical protein
MIISIRERLALKMGVKQHLVTDSYNLNKLLDHDTRMEYQVDVVNSVSVLEGLEMSSVDDTSTNI